MSKDGGTAGMGEAKGGGAGAVRKGAGAGMVMADEQGGEGAVRAGSQGSVAAWAGADDSGRGTATREYCARGRWRRIRWRLGFSKKKQIWAVRLYPTVQVEV